jgi:hypothetical protein
MPFSYYVDPIRKTGFAKFRGTVTLEDIRSYRTQLTADPEWRPEFDRLADYTEVSELSISTLEVVKVAQEAVQLTDKLGEGRLAVVAPSGFIYGMGRMYQMHGETRGIDIEVFRHRESA